MGRYFGGRFGDMHSPTATQPNTKAILSMRDHYYMKKISGGGLQEPATNVTELNSKVSWNFPANYNGYSSNGFQATDYNGSRFRFTNGTGTLEFNNYEYPCYGKFDLRGGDATKDSFFQLYGWQGTPAQFNQSGATEGNMFQMGIYWEPSPNTDSLTNSLEATNAVAGGSAAYFVTSGYGNKTWAWYNGGSNSNSEAQGTQNREAQTTVDWSGNSITFVCYGENAGSNSSKIKIYKDNTLLRTMTTTIDTGRPVYIYLGAGYPNGLATAYSNGQPKFRYGNLPAGLTAL